MLKKGQFIQFVDSSNNRKEQIIRVLKGDVNEIRTRCDNHISREYSIKYIENKITRGLINITS